MSELLETCLQCGERQRIRGMSAIPCGFCGRWSYLCTPCENFAKLHNQSYLECKQGQQRKHTLLNVYRRDLQNADHHNADKS